MFNDKRLTYPFLNLDSNHGSLAPPLLDVGFYVRHHFRPVSCFVFPVLSVGKRMESLAAELQS